MPKTQGLQSLAAKLIERDLTTAGRLLETLPEEEVVQTLSSLPPEIAASLVSQLQTAYAAELLQSAEPSLLKTIARQLEPAHAAAIFARLPHDTREAFIQHLPQKLKQAVREHLEFPENSVGRLMSTQLLAFRETTRVRDAIEKIRSLAQKRYPLSYTYILNDADQLVGVINMRDLMLAQPSQSLEQVMRRDLFTLHPFTDCEEATSELSKRRYFAAPVVDSENRLLGIVRVEQLVQDVQDELASDIQQMFGAGKDERAFSPVTTSLRNRLPWLFVNLATAFLAAAVVAGFENIIAQLTVLAVFLPVVAGQGGNAGAQSLAIVMRGIVMREIPKHKIITLVFKETWLGVITGTITGLTTALIAWIWYQNPFLGLVVGLGMLVNLAAAGLAGAAIPLLMRKLHLDPAQCSSIILTTVTDVVGFFAFLGFASLFQSQLS
ncbi:MAG: magnesium transporter MgtE [Verrucomicrobiota bacterium]|jgi:magnesium transporter